MKSGTDSRFRWRIDARSRRKTVGALFFMTLANAAASAAVTLPIEVVGDDGTTVSVMVSVREGRARDARALRMQIHGLSYEGMVSVQINASAWLPLRNDTVTVAEPEKSYGGIGGAYTTLKVTLPLPAGAVLGGDNTIRFRFNRSDGVASGFRVLAFDFIAGDSSTVLAPSLFTEEDPNAWTPPLPDERSIRAGVVLWHQAQLAANPLPNALRIRAHCSDCHARDGRDLQYFNYSNASIIARCRFHGLTELEGQQIASYIRSLSVPNPGRPWNPPYQPGPGLDAQPIANWAAGAGLSWVLDDDNLTFPFVFVPSSDRSKVSNPESRLNWNTVVPFITRTAFRPDANLNPREIPIALQLPDWNRWLPIVHPLDAWGMAFQQSEFYKWYGDTSAGLPDGRAAVKPSLRSFLASPELGTVISSGRIVSYFERWRNARQAFLKPYLNVRSANWSSDLTQKAYSTQLWQLVKTWEITQEFELEGRGRELYGLAGEPRTWFNTIPAATAPSVVNIPDGPTGMGGSALTNEYFNASWYELQILLNSGNHRHRDRQPVDWVYAVGQFLNLYEQSRRPEPGRLLVAVIKAAQSTDSRLGPDDLTRGWHPNQNVDPRIMISTVWAPLFQPVSRDAKRMITESLLAAWLDKNLQYPLTRYFTPGSPKDNYALPVRFGGISGGSVWKAAPLFKAAGVNPEILRRLEAWGIAYTAMAARLQY